MTKEQREELESMELNLRKDIRETFGDELGKSFEKFLDELHKHIEDDDKKKEEDKPKYKGSIAEEIEKEITDFAKAINKKISKHKDELKKHKFGMIIATHSGGTPTMFMGAGCKHVVRKELVPFIKSELEE